VFGEAGGDPVILLHGGLGNGAHWANQVRALDGAHRVILVDSRGQGRSSASKHGIGYHRMAEDVIALMDHLHVRRAAIVGWSDGGITGLDLAIHHPDRIARLFAFGANYDLSGMSPHGGRAATVGAYFARCRREYRTLSPSPAQLGRVLRDLRRMWASEPTFTEAQLRAIRTPTVIADGDHDEIIRRAHVEKMASIIPGAKLVILKDASHFALWQDPDGFDRALEDFLAAPAPAPAAPRSR